VLVDAATLISLITALGVGSFIGEWYGAGKDRRAARATVLEKLATVEAARWARDSRAVDDRRRADAVRELEIAALTARVPRSAVVTYVQLATAALWWIHIHLESGEERTEPGAISATFHELVVEAAGIVSRAAWGSPATRWL
jgi:hypothetical protein